MSAGLVWQTLGGDDQKFVVNQRGNLVVGNVKIHGKSKTKTGLSQCLSFSSLLISFVVFYINHATQEKHIV